MLPCYRLFRRHKRTLSKLIGFLICSLAIVTFWSLLNLQLSDKGRDAVKTSRSALIFCFVLSINERHVSARAIVYSWGKQCDRFYFVTRLQNTSIDLMMLENFENTSQITPKTMAKDTVTTLLHLEDNTLFTAYDWFLRGSDESYVIQPNLRRLISLLDTSAYKFPIAYVGDVEKMYKEYQISSTGSAMIFNRQALHRLAKFDDLTDEQGDVDDARQECLNRMTYDHEFVSCMRQMGIRINPADDNLILSQNLSTYKMDERLKVKLK